MFLGEIRKGRLEQKSTHLEWEGNAKAKCHDARSQKTDKEGLKPKPPERMQKNTRASCSAKSKRIWKRKVNRGVNA